MSLIVLVALVSTGVSLGLRATSLFLDPSVHPYDRMLLSLVAGVLIVGVTLQVSQSYRVFELGLGVLLSLAPVGPFDVAKWWFRSRGRRSNWLSRAHASAGLIALRLGSLIALAIAALAGSL